MPIHALFLLEGTGFVLRATRSALEDDGFKSTGNWANQKSPMKTPKVTGVILLRCNTKKNKCRHGKPLSSLYRPARPSGTRPKP
jgi:hypothetical protein